MLKGPQGTLFGRNATGGLIQVTTRQPPETPSINSHIGYANYKRVLDDIYLTGALGDGVSGSFAGYCDKQEDG